MTLSRPELLFDLLQRHPIDPSSRKTELTHVSEVLAESGIPVADSLKDEMYEELVRLTQESAENVYGHDRRCSA